MAQVGPGGWASRTVHSTLCGLAPRCQLFVSARHLFIARCGHCRYSVSKEVLRSILKCDTVLGTFDATPKAPNTLVSLVTPPFLLQTLLPTKRSRLGSITDSVCHQVSCR